jgi:hypothetical protein
MSDELQDAMNLQMTAERRRRASVTEANGLREAEILKAQGEREAEILRAQGLREAAFLEAEARERAAEADAKATEVVSKAIAAGDIQAIQFFLGQKYVEALQTIGASDNSKLVLMPLEAAGVTGAIAGIGELVKRHHGRPGQARAGPERPERVGSPPPMIEQAFDWTWAWIIAGADHRRAGDPGSRHLPDVDRPRRGRDRDRPGALSGPCAGMAVPRLRRVDGLLGRDRLLDPAPQRPDQARQAPEPRDEGDDRQDLRRQSPLHRRPRPHQGAGQQLRRRQ